MPACRKAMKAGTLAERCGQIIINELLTLIYEPERRFIVKA